MQSSRRALAFWTTQRGAFSNSGHSVGVFDTLWKRPFSSGVAERKPETRSSAPRSVVTQSVRLVEESASVDRGVLIWTAKHKGHEEPDEPDDFNRQPDADRGIVGRVRYNAWWAVRYLRNHALEHFRSLYMPTGYPHTVKPNYERFITITAIQNIVMSTNSTMSITFPLYAVGLGAGAIPVAGALSWVIKDGLGQLGTLIFGRYIAHDFDINTRTWNFASAAIMNVSCVVEICTLFFPEHFLLFGSAANMLKGLGWMAGGSTRAAFNVSFAKGENIADLTAKSTSQYITTSLIGTAAGVVICGQVESNASLALVICAVLSTFNLLAAWATIRTVPLSTLNHTRMQLLVEQYLRLNMGSPAHSVQLSAPSSLCLVDPVVYVPTLSLDHRFRPNIEVGSQLSSLLRPEFTDVSRKLLCTLRIARHSRHLLLREGAVRNSRIHVVLHEDAGPADAVEAMLHAILFRREIKMCAAERISLDKEMLLLERTSIAAQYHVDSLQESLRLSTWNLERVCVENSISRARW